MGYFSSTLSLFGYSLLVYLIFVVYKGLTGPLSEVPGPFLARFSRLWLLKAIAGKKFDRVIIDLHRKYGPVVRLSPNEFSIDDPEAAKVIYRQRDQLRKAPRYAAWGDPTVEPNMFITSDIAHHTHRRKQIQILYNLDQLFAIEHQLDQATKLFLGKLDNFADKNEVFDMATWIQYYAFDAIACLTFGKPLGFLETGKDVGDIQSTLHTYATYGGIVGVFHELHYTIFSILSALSPKGEVGLAAVTAFKNRQVDIHKAKAQQQAQRNVEASADREALRNDYLTSLYARHLRDPSKFTAEDVDYHSLGNVVAGSETTGITLCAALRYLVIHPTVMAKLRMELEAFWRRRTQVGLIQMKEAQELPYLQAVLKETLRLFPGNGLNLPRVVPKGGLQLAGKFFPEGVEVGVNAYSAHANKAVFGLDADEFRPDRWLMDRESVARMDSYFFAFGRGPRTCTGKHISLMEISKTLPELLLRYDISYADINHDWTYANDWFVLQWDWQVRLRKRNLQVQQSEPNLGEVLLDPAKPVAGGTHLAGIQYITTEV